MKYLSVCSGIEAASVAWQPLGWEAVGFSEIEKFPSQVLAHHYPDVPNFGDMTKYKEWNLDTVNLLVGGTPCQSFSVAGLRKGLEDPRGNLALTYCGILDHFRPQWFVWENVPGVLSSGGGRDFGSFLGAVAQLGYGFAYRVLDAQYFGVAQRRRRVFVVGYFGDWRPAAEVLFEPESLCRDNPPSRKARENASVFTPSSIGNYREGAETLRASGGDLGGGSEHLVAQPYEIGNTLTARMHKGMNSDCNEGQTPVLEPIPIDMRNAGRDPEKHDEMNRQGVGVGNEGDPAHTVTSAFVNAVAHPVAFKETADCLTAAYGTKWNGNASATNGSLFAAQPVVVHGTQDPCVSNIAFAQGRNNGGENVVFAPADVGPSMGASGPPYSRTGNERVEADALAIHNMAVRRLTPVECERLQGFPEINETIRVEICFDHQKSVVNVEIKCRKSQSNALSVGGFESKQLVSIANRNSNTYQASQEPLVALHVHQQSGERSLALRNAQKLTTFASIAEKPSSSHLFTQAESFAATLARIQQTLALTTSIGKEASHPSISLSLAELHGNQSVGTFGGVTEACVSDVNCAANEARFTISSLGRVTVTCDSQIATLLCSVMTATSGFIQNGILPESFSVELTTQSGYTNIPWRKKDKTPDGPRYKALGNSMAVPVMAWIGKRIAEYQKCLS